MQRSSIRFSIATFTLAAAVAASLPARADTVLYQFVALRGGVATCQWFDDNINDRSLDAIIRQSDELYNRTALTPGAAVSNVQTASVSDGTLVAGFELAGTQLCSCDDAINPQASQPIVPPSSVPQ
jgi:hypothetical protein